MELPINYNDAHWTVRKAAREQYQEQQNGDCWYCGMPLSEAPSNEVEAAFIDKSLFPENFFEYPIHLHHNHETGKTIGAVHCKCNAYLWQYKGE